MNLLENIVMSKVVNVLFGELFKMGHHLQEVTNLNVVS